MMCGIFLWYRKFISLRLDAKNETTSNSTFMFVVNVVDVVLTTLFNILYYSLIFRFRGAGRRR